MSMGLCVNYAHLSSAHRSSGWGFVFSGDIVYDAFKDDLSRQALETRLAHLDVSVGIVRTHRCNQPYRACTQARTSILLAFVLSS